MRIILVGIRLLKRHCVLPYKSEIHLSLFFMVSCNVFLILMRIISKREVEASEVADTFLLRLIQIKFFSYQGLLRFTTLTTKSMTGTSINTPTTVANAAPE